MQSTRIRLLVEVVRTQRGSNAKIRKIKGMGTVVGQFLKNKTMKSGLKFFHVDSDGTFGMVFHLKFNTVAFIDGINNPTLADINFSTRVIDSDKTELVLSVVEFHSSGWHGK